MKYIRQSWIQKPRRALGTNRGGMSRMYTHSTRGGTPIRQTKLSPDGLEFTEDVSEARWVEESFSAFGTLRSLLPDGFAAYARIFHPAHLNRDEERPGSGEFEVAGHAGGGEEAVVVWAVRNGLLDD